MFARCCGCLEMVEMLFGNTFLVCMREHERALLLSPKRATLAYAKLTRSSPQVLLELSLRQRAPVLSDINLAHARRPRLSENSQTLIMSYDFNLA